MDNALLSVMSQTVFNFGCGLVCFLSALASDIQIKRKKYFAFTFLLLQNSESSVFYTFPSLCLLFLLYQTPSLNPNFWCACVVLFGFQKEV